MWYPALWCVKRRKMHKENRMPARDDCPNETMKKQVSLCGDQVKCSNEWPEISLALISLFVYFALHLPGHANPKCIPPPLPPSLLSREKSLCANACTQSMSHGSVRVQYTLVRHWCDFSFWLNSCGSAIPHPLPISLQTPLCFDLSVESMHTHTSHAHVCKVSQWWMVLLPAVLRGRKVLKRTKTLDCLCFIIKN